jgi:pyruvate/2-oxoacid:ferredoxin oxidoreductase beta subunit
MNLKVPASLNPQQRVGWCPGCGHGIKLNSSHIEYVFETLQKNPSDIRNIRSYLLTTLYNASLTMDN